MRRILTCLILLVAGSIAVAACGGSGSSTSGSTSASGESSEGGVSGDPYIVYNILDQVPGANFQTIKVGAESAAEYVNEELGGINGRPVQIETCDPKLDPAATTACAQEAISAGALATIGLSINNATNGVPTLEKAGIPSLSVPLAGAEFTSEDSVPLAGGAIVLYTDLGKFAGEQGATKVIQVGNDVPTSHLSTEFLDNGLNATGEGEATGIYTKLGSPDLTPGLVQAVNQDPDFIVLSYGNADVLRALKALKELNWPADKVMLTDLAADKTQLLEPAGSLADGVYIVDPFASLDEESNEDVKLLNEVMQKYAGEKPQSTYNESGFAMIMAIHQAAKEIGGEIEPQQLAEFLRDAEGFPVFASKSLSKAEALEEAPSVHNPWARILQWKGNKLNTVSDWISAAG